MDNSNDQDYQETSQKEELEYDEHGHRKKSVIIKMHKESRKEIALIEEIIQDIQATYIINQEKLPINKIPPLIKAEINRRFADDEEYREKLLYLVPIGTTIRNWVKRKDWDEAVWIRVRGEGLFTPEQRSKVIGTLFEKAIEKGDVAAAKIWLTLSGDYSEKDPKSSNTTIDTFREINKIIHSTKS